MTGRHLCSYSSLQFCFRNRPCPFMGATCIANSLRQPCIEDAPKGSIDFVLPVRTRFYSTTVRYCIVQKAPSFLCNGFGQESTLLQRDTVSHYCSLQESRNCGRSVCWSVAGCWCWHLTSPIGRTYTCSY